MRQRTLNVWVAPVSRFLALIVSSLRALRVSSRTSENSSSPVSPRLFGVSPGWNWRGRDTHADEVAAVNALVALCEHHLRAEEERALGCPIAAGSRAVFLSGENHEGRPGLLVLQAGVVDRHLLARGEMAGDAAFRPGRELIAKPHVGEGAASHDTVVATARAEAVEVPDLDPVRLEVDRSRTVLLNGATGEMWSVVVDPPTIASTRAFSIDWMEPGWRSMSRKNGGSWM